MRRMIKVIISVGKDNLISRRVAEKCGGVLIGTEDSFVSRMITKLTGKYTLSELDTDAAQKYDDLREAMERGKDFVCIYELP